MAKNIQKPLKFGVKERGALIGGGALNGEFTAGRYLIVHLTTLRLETTLNSLKNV